MRRATRRLRLVSVLTPLLMIAAAPPAVSNDDRFEEMAADVKATMLADPNHAITEAKFALAFAERAGTPRMKATALWLLGEGYSRIVQNARAAQILAQARQIVEEAAPGSQLNADILLSEGGVLYATGDVGAALADLRRAHEMFRESGDTRSRAKALIMIALVHATGNDHAGALRYFGQAMEAYRADPGLLVAIHNGRGLALKELKRLPAAEIEINRALAIAREMKSPLLYAQILTNVAEVRLDKHDLASADRAIADGLARTAKPEASAYRPIFLALAARAAFDHGNIAQAQRLIEDRFRNTDLAKTLPPDRQAHDVAFRVYELLGRSDLALPHLAALRRLDEQATATARSNSAAIAAARFDFANQELRIAQLKAADLQKSVAFERARTRTQQQMFFGVAAATLLVIAMLAVGLFTIRRSRNALARSNTALGKALAAKTEFLATTSHEIRTPLNGILGMTQVMLADSKTDAATRERLSVVYGAGTTMRALVDDILDVAKIETGKMMIDEAPTDMRRTIGEAARMWEDQARAKGLRFTLDVAAGPDWAICDSTRLRQIVFNLLSNAVKFTALGHVTMSAEIVDGQRWRLVVADSGIGIPAAKHEIIFEAFRQADTGTTRQFGGTGLGLCICRSLARAMGGDVTVDSETGQGATFTLELPYVPVEMAKSVDAIVPAGVLVVDRNPITRAMFKALLTPVAGTVSFAGNIAEAIAFLAQRSAATVLIDDPTLRTADDHLVAAATIATASRGAVIALLGPPLDAPARSELSAAGISRFIAKPIGKDALVQALFSDEPSAAALVPQAA